MHRTAAAAAARGVRLVTVVGGDERASGQVTIKDMKSGQQSTVARDGIAESVTLLGLITASVAPGGVLIYETFARGNETVGRPARADFLLQPGELLAACAALRTVAYEDGFLDDPARCVQRIAAVREPLAPSGPLRLPLVGTP